METERKILDDLKIDAPRWSCMIFRIEKISNERIKESDERLPQIAFNYKTNQKRKVGRPKKELDGRH